MRLFARGPLRVLGLCAATLVLTTACKKDPPAASPEPSAASEIDVVAAPIPTPPEPPAAPPEAPSPAQAEPVLPNAREILAPGVPFLFAMRESAVFAELEAGCKKEVGGDTDRVKIDLCLRKVETEAMREGIRFDKGEGEQLVYVSFGKKPDGTEDVFLKVAVTVQTGGPQNQLRTKAAGKPEGMQVAKMPPEAIEQMQAAEFVVEAVDATTVVVLDPKKGKLVYHKAQ